MRIFPDSLAALVLVESTPEEWCDSLGRALSSPLLDENKRFIEVRVPSSRLSVLIAKNHSNDLYVVEVSLQEEMLHFFTQQQKHENEDVNSDVGEPCRVPLGDGVWSKEKQAWVMWDVDIVTLAALVQDIIDNFDDNINIIFPWGVLLENKEVQFFLSYLSDSAPFLDGLGLLSVEAVQEITDRWSSCNEYGYDTNALYAVIAAMGRGGVVAPSLWEDRVNLVCE